MGRALTIDSGDTAWMLVSTALVMMMILPGLALFYGGLVRAKNLLSVMSQVLGITAIAILSWILWDYSLAFASGNWLIGGLSKAGLAGLDTAAWAVGSDGKAIPELVFAAFQMSFAAITAALVIGALAERVRCGRREARFLGTADLPNLFRRPSGPGAITPPPAWPTRKSSTPPKSWCGAIWSRGSPARWRFTTGRKPSPTRNSAKRSSAWPGC